MVCCSIVVACFLWREKDLSQGASRVDEKRAFSFPFKCPRCFHRRSLKHPSQRLGERVARTSRAGAMACSLFYWPCLIWNLLVLKLTHLRLTMANVGLVLVAFLLRDGQARRTPPNMYMTQDARMHIRVKENQVRASRERRF